MSVRHDRSVDEAGWAGWGLPPELVQCASLREVCDTRRRNAATVLDFYSAVEAGDAVRAATILGPEVVWHETPGTPYDGAWGGYIGGTEVAAEVLAPFRADVTELRFDTHAVLTYGDTVAALGTYRGRSAARSGELALPCLHIWAFTRDGKITEFRQYTDAAAFCAAVSPSGASRA